MIVLYRVPEPLLSHISLKITFPSVEKIPSLTPLNITSSRYSLWEHTQIMMLLWASMWKL